MVEMVRRDATEDCCLGVDAAVAATRRDVRETVALRERDDSRENPAS